MIPLLRCSVALSVCAVAVGLWGCEGLTYASGTVVSEDGLPLDSARVVLSSRHRTRYVPEDSVLTDSAGRFEVAGPLVGCVPDCPQARLEVSRPGYETYRADYETNWADGLRIRLRPEQGAVPRPPNPPL